MKKILLSIYAIALSTQFQSHAQFTDVINSNRPGESQSAFSVGKKVFQLETGIFGLSEQHSLLDTKTSGFGVDLSLRYGFFLEQLEFILDLQFQNDKTSYQNQSLKRADLKQTTIGAKYLIYDPNKNYVEKVNIYSWKANNRFKWRQLIPAVSIYAGANLDFDSAYKHPDDSTFSPKLALITQNQFTGGYVLVMNFIADKISSEFPSYGYIVTLTKGFNEKWSGFVENQGFKSDLYADSLLRGGAAYLIKENIQIDASITGNFKDTPSVLYGGIGLSWRFDKNYKPILIDGGKSDGDGKGKKDKKEKNRKDGVEIEVEKP